MEQHIVYQEKSEKGRDITLRYPLFEDAQAMCDYINILSKEQTFIRFQGEQQTLAEETKYLKELLEKMNNHQAVQLLAFCEGKLIGNSGVTMHEKVISHIGEFGISIAKDYRGEGIGKTLMQQVLIEAEKEIPQLKIVELTLFGGNTLAERMYASLGFVEFGRLPKGIFHKREYVDHIYMYKTVRT